jgi:mRNA-degrading endonuclease YafQ of YafQ-DinJ toxin-antitoxin module
MINFIYAPVFVKQFNKLDKNLQEEILEKIELFKNRDNHNLLKVHKLHGRFKDSYSFYVNYKIRVVFMWLKEEEVALLAIVDHDVYK